MYKFKIYIIIILILLLLFYLLYINKDHFITDSSKIRFTKKSNYSFEATPSGKISIVLRLEYNNNCNITREFMYGCCDNIENEIVIHFLLIVIQNLNLDIMTHKIIIITYFKI